MEDESIKKVLNTFGINAKDIYPKDIYIRIVDLLLSNPRPRGIPMSFIIDHLLVNLVGSNRDKLNRALRSLNAKGVVRWVVVDGNSSVRLTSAAWEECAKEEPKYSLLLLFSEVETSYDNFSDVVDIEGGRIITKNAKKIAENLSKSVEKILEKIK